MRTCNIQINNDCSVNISDSVDYVGEHRATELSIQLNSELTSDSISYYTLSFKPGAALKNPPPYKLTSDMIPKTSDHISYRLPASLTCYGSLDAQVLAHCLGDTNEVTEIIKSPVFRIFFKPSITGDEELFLEEARYFTELIHTALAQLNLTLDEADELCDIINEAYENGELNGAVIIPYIDEEGTLSWSNDSGFENPEPINLKGEKGEKGDSGAPGKNATINGHNAVTINTDGDLEFSQDGETITLSCNSVKFYDTLPETAQDGNICLYSPINTLTPDDGGKPIYINYSDLLSAVETEYSTFNISLFDAEMQEIGHLFATSFFENNDKMKYFDVVLNDRRWFVYFTNNEFIPEKSFYEQNTEREILLMLPRYFTLPYFSSTEITYDTTSGNIFYAPPRLMFYRGGWHEFNPLSHTHENYNTLDYFSCNALDNPITDGDFNIGINTEDWNRLKFRGDTVLFASDGAVVRNVEVKEDDSGKKFFRMHFNKPGLDISPEPMTSFVDIPINDTNDKVEIGLNGSGLELELPTGGVSRADMETYVTAAINGSLDEIETMIDESGVLDE